MTDIMKLADDYARAYMSFGEAIARAALQSAINALQAENESLRNGVIDLQTQLALTCSKLDALQTQDPVAWSITVGGEFKNCVEITHNEADAEGRLSQLSQGGFRSLYTLHRLYAAPKAPTHEQVEEAWRAGWAACRDAEYVGQEAEDEAWGMSQTCANADWESAAPKALEPLTNGDHIHPNAEGRARVMEAIEAAHGIGASK